MLTSTLLVACEARPPAGPSGSSSSAAGTPATPEEPVVNVYNWPDYVDRSVVERFSRETGLKVNYDTFDSAEAMEAKLSVGHTNYDVVVPSAAALQRQLKAGYYRALDRALLTHYGNLDAGLLQRIAVADPGNTRTVPYHWGTVGVGYDAKQILARMPGAPVDSAALIFDPQVARRFADCGIVFIDSPMDVIGTVLLYLGKDPNSESAADLAAAERVLMSIRPYVRYINTPPVIGDLASGDACLALTWSGDALRARARARDAGSRADVHYMLPREGGVMTFDLLAIPTDAPHPTNAHRFIDFLMRADVAAQLGATLQYANANAASWPLYPAALRDDPAVFPSAAVQARLVVDREESREFRRLATRVWTRFRTGQ
jgi:putrescine transport system substrate-binding protein